MTDACCHYITFLIEFILDHVCPQILYARSKTSDVLWYGVRPSVCPSVRPLATLCLLNIVKSF